MIDFNESILIIHYLKRYLNHWHWHVAISLFLTVSPDLCIIWHLSLTLALTQDLHEFNSIQFNSLFQTYLWSMAHNYMSQPVLPSWRTTKSGDLPIYKKHTREIFYGNFSRRKNSQQQLLSCRHTIGPINNNFDQLYTLIQCKKWSHKKGRNPRLCGPWLLIFVLLCTNIDSTKVNVVWFILYGAYVRPSRELRATYSLVHLSKNTLRPQTNCNRMSVKLIICVK